VKVASIVPVSYLYLIQSKNYHMCLAHLANSIPRYADFYKEQAQKGKFVIMDNGAAEGEQQRVDTLVRLAASINPTELILPDVLYDSEATLDRSYKAIDVVKRSGLECRLMAVPQGRTLHEWVGCALEMLQWPVDTIGISKFLNYVLGPYVRLLAIAAILPKLKDKDIHLLGCACDAREVGVINDFFGSRVRGVDSSIAYIYARSGINMHNALRNNIPRSQAEIDFMEESTDTSLISDNITIWEDVCNGRLL